MKSISRYRIHDLKWSFMHIPATEEDQACIILQRTFWWLACNICKVSACRKHTICYCQHTPHNVWKYNISNILQNDTQVHIHKKEFNHSITMQRKTLIFELQLLGVTR